MDRSDSRRALFFCVHTACLHDRSIGGSHFITVIDIHQWNVTIVQGFLGELGSGRVVVSEPRRRWSVVHHISRQHLVVHGLPADSQVQI
jgi:hypothetical protein